MNKEQLIALGLTPEQAAAVSQASADELKGYVPKADYEQLDTTKKTLEGQLNSIETKVKTLVKDAKGSTLEEQLGAFQQGIETERINAKKQLDEMQFSHTLEKALTTAKAKNAQTVKALLKMENLKLNADGSITGLNEQLTAIQKSDAYLFADDNSAGGGTGSTGNFARRHDQPSTETLGERLGKQAAAQTVENPYFK